MATNNTNNTNNIKTEQMKKKAAEARVIQSTLKGSYQPSRIIKSVALEGKASYLEYAVKNTPPKSISTISSVSNDLVSKVKSSTSSNNDLGSNLVGSAITTSQIGYTAAKTGFKVAQAASPVATDIAVKSVNGVIKTAKGTWDVATTLGKATVSVTRTTAMIKSRFIPFKTNSIRDTFINQAKATGLVNTTTTKGIIHGVENIKRGVSSVKTGVVKVGKGTWDVATTLGKTTVSVVKTTAMIKSGFIPFKAASLRSTFVTQAKTTGLIHSATSKNIIRAVNSMTTNVIKTKDNIHRLKTNIVISFRNVKKGVVNTAKATKKGVISSYNFARVLVKNKLIYTYIRYKGYKAVCKSSMIINKGTRSLGKGLGKGINIVSKGVVRGTVKGSMWTIRKGIPKAYNGIASSLSSSDDMMVAGVGNAMKLTKYTVKTSKVAGKVSQKAIKTSVKTSVRTVKFSIRTFKYVHKNGLKKGAQKALKKTGSAFVKAGKSAVSAIINLAKVVGRKAIIPLLLICILFTVVSAAAGAPIAGIGSIFGGVFDMFFGDDEDEKYTETDVREFISNTDTGIPAKRTKYINDLYKYIESQREKNGGKYDYVRFKSTTTNEKVEPTVDGITSVFYTEEELVNIIQPIFNGMLLYLYDLEPTDKESQHLLDDIFDRLFWRKIETTKEWCGQKEGAPVPLGHMCGHIHAHSDCPNKITGKHDKYTCPDCCYKYCPGHEKTETEYIEKNNIDSFLSSHKDDEIKEKKLIEDKKDKNCGKYKVTYIHRWKCKGCKDGCKGYSYCGGHDVLTVTLNMDGLYKLLYEYYEKPIERLTNIPEDKRLESEKKDLTNLKDSYDICLEMVKLVGEQYGGGVSKENLEGVKFKDGTRKGNKKLIDLALTQVGNVGGEPYWRFCGYENRVAWCACFVSWVMMKNDYDDVFYTYCPYGINYFKGKERFASNDYKDLVAGDVIFFDWQGDGESDHTGLVIGTDGTYVYTVEGNCSDVCKTKKYELGSSVIVGYGLMNY